MSEDLDFIDPTPLERTINGKTIQIKPLKVGKIPAFARAITPLSGALQKIEEFSPADLIELLGTHGESIIKAVSIASGVTEADLNEADPAELIGLIAPIIKVNADFFRLRQTLLNTVVANLAAKVAHGAGPTP